MKIIFLDIDGVLIPSVFKKYVSEKYESSNGLEKSKDVYGFLFSPICAGKLNYIVHETQANIVIISDWKKHVSLTEFGNMWRIRNMAGKVIDVSPTTETNMRSDGVLKYIVDNDIKDYVILDDLPQAEYPESMHSNLIVCNSKEGITNDVMFKAIEILNHQPMLFL